VRLVGRPTACPSEWVLGDRSSLDSCFRVAILGDARVMGVCGTNYWTSGDGMRTSAPM
jgi:hypothetical protein